MLFPAPIDFRCTVLRRFIISSGRLLLLVALLVLVACATDSIKEIPSEDSAFLLPPEQLMEQYPVVENFEMDTRVEKSYRKKLHINDVITQWGPPLQRYRQWWTYADRMVISTWLLSVINDPELWAVMVPLLVFPLPQDELVWEKGNYRIVAGAFSSSWLDSNPRLLYWRWYPLSADGEPDDPHYDWYSRQRKNNFFFGFEYLDGGDPLLQTNYGDVIGAGETTTIRFGYDFSVEGINRLLRSSLGYRYYGLGIIPVSGASVNRLPLELLYLQRYKNFPLYWGVGTFYNVSTTFDDGRNSWTTSKSIPGMTLLLESRFSRRIGLSLRLNLERLLLPNNKTIDASAIGVGFNYFD